MPTSDPKNADRIAYLLDQLSARLTSDGPDSLFSSFIRVTNAMVMKAGPAEEAKDLTAALRSAAALASELASLTDPGDPAHCSLDARIEVGGVLITGHTMTCPHGEPRHYTWQDSGTLRTGTLADYAKAWEHGTYSGDGGLGGEVRTWDATYWIKVEHLNTDNDWISFGLTAGNESVVVTIDGRA
ncbi:hypothetical protein [Actinomadura sp. 3N508]|uniref:hypothetical protein n=1 Tax=Actinomadura sp. 3N508 TaxID=3375153 RepID=UPI003794D865